MRERKERKYRESKTLVKRLVRESKGVVDEDFGRKLRVHAEWCVL